MTETTFYPGIGADEAIDSLHKLVGNITASWAEIEDGLFHVFVIAIAGVWHVADIRPYRAVFFTFSSFEGKQRLTESAMRARYQGNTEVLGRWKTLNKAMSGFSKLRNEVAHLIPKARMSTDPTAPARVRLIPPFWKASLEDGTDFDTVGYSEDELWKALRPYWGYHPKISLIPPEGDEAYTLGYRLQQFAYSLPQTPR